MQHLQVCVPFGMVSMVQVILLQEKTLRHLDSNVSDSDASPGRCPQAGAVRGASDEIYALGRHKLEQFRRICSPAKVSRRLELHVLL